MFDDIINGIKKSLFDFYKITKAITKQSRILDHQSPTPDLGQMVKALEKYLVYNDKLELLHVVNSEFIIAFDDKKWVNVDLNKIPDDKKYLIDLLEEHDKIDHLPFGPAKTVIVGAWWENWTGWEFRYYDFPTKIYVHKDFEIFV